MPATTEGRPEKAVPIAVVREGPRPGGEIVWPSWLPSFSGGDLQLHRGTDHRGRPYLEGEFPTALPVTAMYLFYGELLKQRGYTITKARLRGPTSGEGRQAAGYIEAVVGDTTRSDALLIGFSWPKGDDLARISLRYTVSAERSF